MKQTNRNGTDNAEISQTAVAKDNKKAKKQWGKNALVQARLAESGEPPGGRMRGERGEFRGGIRAVSSLTTMHPVEM